jgi:phosphate transport system protein
MSDKHLSTQFDAELSGISTRVLEMGGMVESQVARAMMVERSRSISTSVWLTRSSVSSTSDAISALKLVSA